MHTRKLNEIEYLNWLIGQPYNVSMALTIEGNLNEEKVRKSLEKVQKKHPILQAQLDVNKQGEPYFSWNEIDQVPIDIIPRTDDLLYRKVVAEEFLTPFETGFDCSLPLMRVKLLNGESCSDLIITLPHLICDGMSLMFLFQDILEFIAEPTKKTKPIEIIKNVEEILPSSFQKKIPKTAIKFKILVWFVKKIMLLGKVKRKLKKKWKNQKKLVSNNEKRQFLTREWVLTEDQSQVLFKKCEENGVTVHSALCTMFLPDFPTLNTPVNLREKLRHNVGESVGMFAGALIIKKKYKESLSFWKNCQNYHLKLVNQLNSDKIFKVYKLINKAVLIEEFKEIMALGLPRERGVWLTNLGSLDKFNNYIASKGFNVKNVYGGASATYEAMFFAVVTLNNKLYFQLYCYKPPYNEKEIENYVKNALRQLNAALNN
ncbi:MAG: condensation domain-containing protein [Promethearchaeota archaeon]|jgi:NRPS condensation-like uncharacterized protein